MWVQAIGWLGTVLYLTSYLYLSIYKHASLLVYHACNFVAAACITVVSVVLHSWQAVVINVIWGLISVARVFEQPLGFLRFKPAYLEAVLGLCSGVALFALPFLPAFSFNLMAWSATMAFCLGYLLFASEMVGKSRFFIYNAFAALVILPQLWVDVNYPTFAMEMIWFVISIYGWRSGHSGKSSGLN